MRKMSLKKIAAFVLAGTMAIGMSATVFAEDNQNASFTKTYKIANEGTTSPAESFTFEFKADKVEGNSALSKIDMPSIADATTSYEAGTATTAGLQKTVNVALSDVTWPGVGVYYYDVTEKTGSTAGVDYDQNTAKLKVTVANDSASGTYYVAFVTMSLADENKDGQTDSKTGGFTNEYKAVKDLTISKTVAGQLGDKTKYFKIKVTLNNPSDKTAPSTYTVSGGKSGNPTTITAGTETEFEVKNGDTLHIANVPYGVTYTVAEEDYSTDGYTVTYKVNNETKDAVNGEEVDAAAEAVDITNTKAGTIDTGVIMNYAPYIAMLAAACVFAVVFFKRNREDA